MPNRLSISAKRLAIKAGIRGELTDFQGGTALSARCDYNTKRAVHRNAKLYHINPKMFISAR